MQYYHICITMHCTYHVYLQNLLEVQKYCTVSRNRWIAIIPGKLRILILHCNIYSLGPAKALLFQSSTKSVCLIRLHRSMQHYRFKEIGIWCHQSGSSMVTAVDAVLVLLIQRMTILSADTPLHKHCLFHFQWIHQLWTYPYLLSILNPYRYSFFINSLFLRNNTPIYQYFTNNQPQTVRAVLRHFLF